MAQARLSSIFSPLRRRELRSVHGLRAPDEGDREDALCNPFRSRPRANVASTGERSVASSDQLFWIFPSQSAHIVGLPAAKTSKNSAGLRSEVWVGRGEARRGEKGVGTMAKRAAAKDAAQTPPKRARRQSERVKTRKDEPEKKKEARTTMTNRRGAAKDRKSASKQASKEVVVRSRAEDSIEPQSTSDSESSVIYIG